MTETPSGAESVNGLTDGELADVLRLREETPGLRSGPQWRATPWQRDQRAAHGGAQR